MAKGRDPSPRTSWLCSREVIDNVLSHRSECKEGQLVNFRKGWDKHETWNTKHVLRILVTRVKPVKSQRGNLLRICRLCCRSSFTKAPIGIYNYRRFSDAVQPTFVSLSLYSHWIRHSGRVFLQEYLVSPTAHCWRTGRAQNDGSVRRLAGPLVTGYWHIAMSNLRMKSRLGAASTLLAVWHPSVPKRSDWNPSILSIKLDGHSWTYHIKSELSRRENGATDMR